MDNVRRLVSVAAFWNRRNIGAIRLDQDAIEWDLNCGIPHGLSVSKRENPGKRYLKSNIQECLRIPDSAGKAVRYPAQTLSGILPKDVQAIGVCVAAVDDKGQLRLNGDFYVPPENGLLRLSCRIVVVVVQARLTHAHHRCIVGEFGQSPEIGRGGRVCIMRMDACRGGHETGMFPGKLNRDIARLNPASHGYDMSHPRRAGAIQYRVKVRREPLVVQVGVRVYERVLLQFHLAVRSNPLFFQPRECLQPEYPTGNAHSKQFNVDDPLQSAWHQNFTPPAGHGLRTSALFEACRPLGYNPIDHLSIY